MIPQRPLRDLHLSDAGPIDPSGASSGDSLNNGEHTLRIDRRRNDRRAHRRHEVAGPKVIVERVGEAGTSHIGTIGDLSAAGVRIFAAGDLGIRPGETIDIRLALPEHAGISPFIRLAGQTQPEPAYEWVGQLEVLRCVDRGEHGTELGGRLIDMTAADRGMLGLYLSIQPLAA